MEIADRTPYRNESGQVDIFGRIQGTLKFGFDWYTRIEAQNAVIAVLDKVLGANYILLRNISLPETDIELPMVLIGPPGLYLIQVTADRGVYRARDDEWGTVAGERFVPSGKNPVLRTLKLGRVLQIYLDRGGFKDKLLVEPILMAADPGMHIESVRPAVRIVMSDALERFATSMNQARPIHNSKMIGDIAQTIINGPRPQTSPPVASGAQGQETPIAIPEADSSQPFAADTLEFSFDDQEQNQDGEAKTGSQNATLRAAAFSNDNDRLDALQNSRNQVTPFPENGAAGKPNQGKPTKSAPKKKGPLGMSTTQVIILGSILLFWLCALAAFVIYIYTTL